MTDNALVRLSAAAQALVEAKDLNEVKQIRDLAQAAGVYARAAKLGLDAQNTAAEIKLRAERKAGEMLAQLERNPGPGRGQKISNVGNLLSEYRQVLDDTGTSFQEANRWQSEATMPEEVFEAHIAEAKAERKELTTAGVLEEVRSLTQAENRKGRVDSIIAKNKPLDTGKRYSVIYADPPWRYEYSISNSREVENHYPTMDLEQICLLPVPGIAAQDAILFMWTTSPKLEESMQVIRAWGFNYRTCLVWVKDKIGMGYYARQRHELLLIAKRGDIPPPDTDARFDSVIEAPRQAHSEKPHVVYDMIETMYPEFDRIELFARNRRAGWDSWGNQV